MSDVDPGDAFLQPTVEVQINLNKNGQLASIHGCLFDRSLVKNIIIKEPNTNIASYLTKLVFHDW
jgi:hypothetical protein